METKLSPAEELLLLALNDEKGTVLIRASTALPYGLTGALIIELAWAGLVRLEGKELIPETRGSARDGLLDGILEKIRASKKPRTIGHWVTKFGFSGGKLKRELLDRLVAKRVLGREEGRVLWIFPTARYPQADTRPEYAIRERIRSVLRGMARPDERTAALISLVEACDLTAALFDKGERRDAKKRAKEITKGHPIGSAVAKAIEAVKAAVIAAAGS